MSNIGRVGYALADRDDVLVVDAELVSIDRGMIGDSTWPSTDRGGRVADSAKTSNVVRRKTNMRKRIRSSSQRRIEMFCAMPSVDLEVVEG